MVRVVIGFDGFRRWVFILMTPKSRASFDYGGCFMVAVINIKKDFPRYFRSGTPLNVKKFDHL